MNRNQQHRVRTMQIYDNTAKKYKKPIPPDAGTRLKYGIKELRPHPGKLTKAFQEHEKETDDQETKHDWVEWEDYQKTLGKLLGETYPLIKKAAMEKEPE